MVQTKGMRCVRSGQAKEYTVFYGVEVDRRIYHNTLLIAIVQ